MRQGVYWKDMGVVNRPTGQPTMSLTGGAALRLAALTPPGHFPVIHLTITDEYPYAQAFVVIEVLPEAPATSGEVVPLTGDAAARRLAEATVNV